MKTRTYEFKVQYQAFGYFMIFMTLGLLPTALDQFRTIGQTIMTLIIASVVLCFSIIVAAGKFEIDEDEANEL